MTGGLFLDRDGVVNLDLGYVCHVQEFVLIRGIVKLIRSANELGMPVIIVTNQAGIGRGLYSEDDFSQLNAWMCGHLLLKGARVDAVYFCPFHSEFGVGSYKRVSFLRKPDPGMLLRAAFDLGLDLTKSVLIGDKLTDVRAGIAAGLRRIYLYRSLDSSPNAQQIVDFSDVELKFGML